MPARKRARRWRVAIEGNNLHFRTDIGWRDVERIYHHADQDVAGKMSAEEVE